MRNCVLFNTSQTLKFHGGNNIKRLAYLDVIRVLSVLLVMWGHFISVGGNATSLPLIINEKYNQSLPIYEGMKWGAGRFEIFLINYFNTQTAVLGVSLFFW